TMFFAIGAYAVAVPLSRGWVGWDAVVSGAVGGALLAAVVAALIALLSLRVRKLFFSMVTLAVASLAPIVASQWGDMTGGEAVAGALMALLLRYNGPQATLSFEIMVDLLLMVVIGGMGTLYGPALGATVIVLAQYYLQPGLQAASDAASSLPVLAALLHPDR